MHSWVPQGRGAHLAHPVHSGADQVESADADGPHAIGCQGLTVGTQLLSLGAGGQDAVWGHWGLGEQGLAPGHG